MADDPKDEQSKGVLSDLTEMFGNGVKTITKAGGRLDFNLFSESARIAVVGASRSGKTVLLTSLIDHLRNHDPRRFRIKASSYSRKDYAHIENYEVLEVSPGMTAFPYDAFRQALIQDACWPQKTKDTYQYRLKIYRDDSVIDRILKVKFSTTLSFLDFPGERIADALITSLSYADWSDYVLGALPVRDELGPLVHAYQEAMMNQGSDEHSLISSYKRILVERLRQFHTAITPSTFVLCPSGTTPARDSDPRDLLEERFTGLSREQQFCPLDSTTRKARPELSAKFSEAYRIYQAQLILPLYRALAASDQLCLLVNIPEILQSGVEAYNDHIELLQQVVGFCSPKRNTYVDVLRRISKSVGKVFISDAYRPGGVEKIAFVATQADRVRPEEVNRLKKLILEFQRNCTRALPHADIRMEAFTCVAVQATKPVNRGRLQGRLMSTSPQTPDGAPDLEEYAVSSLPGEWPAQWIPDEYIFPDVWPKFHQNKNVPPEQIGMDRVFNYLIS